MVTISMKNISEVRTTLGRLVRDEPVSHESTDSARDALWSLLEEGSDHGLTYADVIRSVLGPVFELKRGCDCPTCKMRRGDLDHGNAEPASVA